LAETDRTQVALGVRAEDVRISPNGGTGSGRSFTATVGLKEPIGSDTFVEQLRRLREDDTIKAIVLRVDSPGGSSVASDVIWRELVITRDDKPAREVVREAP